MRILLWFEVDVVTGKKDLDKPVVYQRDIIDCGDKSESVITEVGLGKFCASACQLAATAKMLRDKRYADYIADSIRSILIDRSDGKKLFLAIRKDLIEACKAYGFKIKMVLSSWDTDSEIMEQQRELIYNPTERKKRGS